MSQKSGPVVLFAGLPEDWTAYQALLSKAFAEKGIAAELVLPGQIDPEKVDYIIYHPTGPVQDFSGFTNTKAVLSLWAGAERIVGNKTLTQPLCRMVDEGLSRGMVEWVTGQVLRAHLGFDRYIVNPSHEWRQVCPPLAPQRKVTVLGLGTLGAACAAMLVQLGFDVAGWSRTPKSLPGIQSFHGAEGLEAALARSEILVLLLPDTPETRDLMDARRLAMLPKGAMLINAGRGTAIVDEDLLAALDCGAIGHATLDVFRTEPLPPEHRYWGHPRVTVSPHVAALTHPGTATPVLVENIRRGEAGEPFLYQVDRSRAY